MKKRLKRLLVLLLTFCLILSQMTIPVGAATTSNINDYIFYYRYNNIEKTDGHEITNGNYWFEERDANGKAIFIDWIALLGLRPEDSSDASDLVAAYCADWAQTFNKTSSNNRYKRVNLEDSSYFNGKEKYIIEVLKEGYWNTWTDEDLNDARKDINSNSLTRLQALAATQLAVWYFSDDNPDFYFFEKAGMTMPPASHKKNIWAYRDFLVNYAIGVVNDTITDKNPDITQIPLYTNEKFANVSASIVETSNNVYDLTVNVTLINPIDESLGENFTLKLGVGAKEYNLKKSKDVYTKTLSGLTIEEIKELGNISIEISGEQYSKGYYFYEAYAENGESARTVAQNMVGWAEGLVPVSAKKEIAITVIDGVKNVEVSNSETAPDNDFTFQLSENGQVIQEVTINGVTLDKSGEFNFKPIVYTEAGEHNYVISEKQESDTGWTYDTKTYNVKVTVTEDTSSGELNIVVDNPNAIEFTNIYEPLETQIVFGGNKEVTGGTAPEGGFTFELYEVVDGSDVYLQSETGVTGGDFNFDDAIKYTSEGTHTYKIKEVEGTVPGWTYDKTVRIVTVEVKDIDGQLVATPSLTNDKIRFENTYKAAEGEITLGGHKTVTGGTAPEGGFTFELYEVVAGNDVYLQSETGVTGGDFNFDDAIKYTSEGTHTYKIKEVEGTVPGWTYDKTVRIVTVEVKDIDGQLVATPSLTNDKIRFENTYKAAEGEITLGGHKTISGGTAPEGGFTFELYEVVDGSDVYLQSETGVTDGNFTFDKAIKYASEGTHTYKIKEVEGNVPGWTYDKTIHTVTVDVKDVDGQLVATPSIANSEITFTNTYKASGTEITLGGHKTVEGGTAPEGGFTFELYEVVDGNDVYLQSETGVTGGDFTFDKAIEYTSEGTHTYKIKEVEGTVPGWIYDKTVHTVTVEVKDVDGQLVAEPSIGNSEITFTNTYKASGTEITLGGHKTVEGGTAPEGGFTFELYEVVDGNDVYLQSETGVTGGDFTFDDAIKYASVGTHTYKIKEIEGTVPGWTYDKTVYTVIVEVTDNDGQLTVTPSLTNEEVTFTNTYTKPAPAATEATIEGKKFVNGISETDEEFAFILAEDGVQIDSVTIEGKGSFEFDTITYTEEGTHTYTVFELDGDAENWKYDNHKFKVTVNVTEDAEGNLKAEVNYADGAIKFTNTYKEPVQTPSDATPSDATSSNATAVIKGEKRVQGIGTSNKLFTFILMEDGVEIDRATTMGAGFFKFDTLKFTEEGEHTYTVHELQGDAAGWTYDDTVYTVTIVVTKEGNKLVAEVEYEDGAIVFTNIYEEPEKPTVPGKKEDDDDDDTPKPTKSTEPETVPETVPETAPEAPSEVLGDEDIVGYDPNGVLGAYDQLPVGVLPATGDSALIWVLGMILSGLGLTGVNFKSKKRKNK